MKNKEYWIKRDEQRIADEDENIKNLEKYLETQYNKASKDIEKEIRYLISKYQKDGEFTYIETLKLLTGSEYKEFRYDLETYIKLIEETADEELLKELNTLSKRARLTRLERMLFDISKTVNNLSFTIKDKMTEFLENSIKETYNKTVYNAQQFLGLGFTFAKVSKDYIIKTLNKPWAGSNYSNRIWKHRDRLKSNLKNTITDMLIRGVGVNKASKELKDKTKDLFIKTNNNIKSHFKAIQRLIRTEHAYYVEQSTKKAYNELDVEKYEILATLDTKTSAICRALDGKVFKIDEAIVGINYPPFHQNCRTTTIPYFDDVDDTRVARDKKGKTIRISSKMKYNEWYKKFAK